MAPPIVHTVYHPGAEGPLPTVVAIQVRKPTFTSC